MSNFRSKEWLQKKYIDEDMSMREIADCSEASKSGVRYYIDKYDIVKERKYRNSDWLKQKYIEEEKTSREVASLCNASESTVTRLLKKFDIDTRKSSEESVCPACDDKYTSMGCHWNFNPSHRPSFNSKQKQIMTGLLMSDGYIRNESKNPSFRAKMANKKYLDYLDEIFSPISVGVKKRNKETTQEIYGTECNKKAQYEWRTVTHPELKEYLDWYSTGEKKWPTNDIELTPTVMKHLYVGDGNYNQKSKSISISMSNEAENIDSVKEMFERVGIGDFVVSDYVDSDNTRNFSIRFRADETRQLFEYMGKPVPGFEYKWPDELTGQ